MHQEKKVNASKSKWQTNIFKKEGKFRNDEIKNYK